MSRLLFLLVAFVLPSSVWAGDDAVKQSIAYVRKQQTQGGGFRANEKAPPSLKATSSAVRALHYLGGELPDKAACIKFVESCWNSEAGGFGDHPDGKPDVFTTAVGLMAVVELKIPSEKYTAAGIKFMSEHAKSFEDIRIAAAGLETIKAKSPRNNDWLKEVLKLRNKDGTFGKGLSLARDTGGATVTILRLGGEVDPGRSQRTKLLIIKTLKDGQRQNGGYGKDDSEIASDLETTYRVMRCFKMLSTKPGNVEGVRSFVAKCRNPDGGYAVMPGQPSSVGGTYFAAIILHWLKN